MMDHVRSLLKIRPDEGRLVLLVGGLFMCIQAGQGLGDNAASALFFLRFGVDFLPYMYLLLGGTTFVITLGYSTGLGRFKSGRFFTGLIVGLIGLLLVERFILELDFPLSYPILWLTINGMGMILGTFTWNVAGEVSDARQAKRLFPLFTSAGILGSVLGNSVTGVAARALGADNLLVFYAGLLVLAFFLTRTISRDFFRPTRASADRTSLLGDLSSGFDYVRHSSLMRLIALASILFSILFFSIAFPFNKVISASFPDEAQVAGFLGTFSSISTAVTFLVSLLLANRVYARLGIVNSVLLMPLTYIFGFIVFAGRYSLNGAVIARFAQLVILSAIAGTAWNAFFNVVPSQKRGQVLAFQNGVPSQIGVALSGVLLILGERIMTTIQILQMGILVTLVCGWLVWRMRSAYGQALIEALRAGRLEVFSSGEESFAGLEGDAAVLHVVTQALEDPRPTTRRLAAEILGRMGNVSAIPSLMRRLSDPQADVRAAVIASLGELCAQPLIQSIPLMLGDSNANVRRQTLYALTRLEPEVSPLLLEKMVEMLDDVERAVRVQAAVTLGYLGSGEQAEPKLMAWLASSDLQSRVDALEAIRQVSSYLGPAIERGLILQAIKDPASIIRSAACRALTDLSDEGICKALVERLQDPDSEVRRAAVETLRRHPQQTHSMILELFETESPAAETALEALTAGNPETFGPLRRYAHKEIVHTRDLRTWIASLPPQGRALPLLRTHLDDLALQSEQRLVRVVGLLGNQETMDLVRRNLHQANPESRSAALEALETLGDLTLSRGIVTLLEEEPSRSTPAEVIENLLASRVPWTRALAARAIPELGLKEFTPRLRDLQSDPHPIPREAASDALDQLNEDNPMKTMQTISTLERVLLLREVPIFAHLTPQDLEGIAQIAEERFYAAGTKICHQGEEGDVMFVIVTGQVQIVSGPQGQEKVLAERGEGDFVGEMAILDPAPRSAGMTAHSDTRLLAIEGEAFKAILRERPDVSIAVMQGISRRLREMMA